MGRAASKAGAGGRAGACRRGAASRGATFFFAPASTVWPPAARLRSTRVFLGRRVCPGRALACVSARSSAHALARPPVPHHGRRRAQRQRQAAGRGERGGEREARAWEKCERGGGIQRGDDPPFPVCAQGGGASPDLSPTWADEQTRCWLGQVAAGGGRTSFPPPPAGAGSFRFCLRLRPGAPPSRRARELRRWQPRVFSFLLGGGAPYTCAPAAAGPFPHASLACAAGGNP